MLIPRITLLVHGVTSTGEWHPTTRSVLDKLFLCRPVKYRYYHSLLGPLKPYVSPTALSMVLAVLLVPMPQLMPRVAHVAGIRLGLLALFTAFLTVNAIRAERDWAEARRRWLDAEVGGALWKPPLVFAGLGLAMAVLGWDALAAGLGGAMIAISFFLDLREYTDKKKQLKDLTLWCVPLLLEAACTFGAWSLTAAGNWATVSLPIAAGLLLVGVAEALWIRGKLAFELLHAEVGEACRTGLQVNIIAHCLGTYLVGHVLNEVDDAAVRCVVFSGCVLERGFPWRRSVGPGSRQTCVEVWNYAAGCDPVPLITGFLRLVWVVLTFVFRLPGVRSVKDLIARMANWRALGSGGNLGFRCQQEFIHQLDAGAICTACEEENARAPIHNVVSLYSRHSSLNQAPDFQRSHWLPALLGIRHDEYRFWLELCRNGYQYAQPRENGTLYDAGALSDAEHALLTMRWLWPVYVGGRPVPARAEQLHWYVGRIAMQRDPRPAQPEIDQAMKRLPRIYFEKVWQGWQAGTDAVQATQFEKSLARLIYENVWQPWLKRGEANQAAPEKIVYLDPRQALAAAFEDALEVGTPQPPPGAQGTVS